MADAREFWQTMHHRFDPQGLPTPAWRVDRPDSPVSEIAELMFLPFGKPKVLLGSTPGTGTTTELRRLQDAVRDSGRLGVMLDLQAVFANVVGDLAALRDVTPQEVVFLVGLSIHNFAVQQYGHRWDDARVEELENAWSDVLGEGKASGGPSVNVAKLSATVGATILGALVDGGTGVAATTAAAGAKALGDVGQASAWTFKFGGGHRRWDDQDRPTRRLKEAVSQMIAEVQREHGQDVLLILDGLDRIDEPETTTALFVKSNLIGDLPCSIVAAAPISLRHGLESDLVRPFDYRVLPNVPVIDRERPLDPDHPGPGLATLQELYRRRTDDLDPALGIPDEPLLRLARASGGHVREFVTLIRQLSIRAFQASTPHPRPDDVDHVLSQFRIDKERGLRKNHWEVLGTILADLGGPLPEHEEVDELLRIRRLLPYTNGSEWFFPHPMLVKRLQAEFLQT